VIVQTAAVALAQAPGLRMERFPSVAKNLLVCAFPGQFPLASLQKNIATAAPE
jgi:hypothetical protein